MGKDSELFKAAKTGNNAVLERVFASYLRRANPQASGGGGGGSSGGGGGHFGRLGLSPSLSLSPSPFLSPPPPPLSCTHSSCVANGCYGAS